MLAMADVNTSRTEKTPTAVLCARERTMLRDRRCRAFGNSCRQARDAHWRPCQPGGQATRGWGPMGEAQPSPPPPCVPALAQLALQHQPRKAPTHRATGVHGARQHGDEQQQEDHSIDGKHQRGAGAEEGPGKHYSGRHGYPCPTPQDGRAGRRLQGPWAFRKFWEVLEGSKST